MQYEVEMKFPLAEPSAIERQLAALGAVFSAPVVEIDSYYKHPCRDFAATDEAFRIRRAGGKARATYKGPKVDALTKTRRELELAIEPDQADAWAKLFESLGFQVLAEVRKQRRKAHIVWGGRQVELSLDHLDRLGSFLEVESMADESELAAARECVLSVAAHLGLTASERRSYLALLLGVAEK